MGRLHFVPTALRADANKLAWALGLQLESGNTFGINKTDGLTTNSHYGCHAWKNLFPETLPSGVNWATYGLTEATALAALDSVRTRSTSSTDTIAQLATMVGQLKDLWRTKKWFPGHYSNPLPSHYLDLVKRDEIYAELAATPALRGIQIGIDFGLTETNLNTYDFSIVGDALDRSAAIGKYVMLGFSWREFESSAGMNNLLPADMRGSSGSYTDDPNWAHTIYTNAWAYKKSNSPGNYGYNLKLSSSTVQARLDNYFSQLSQYVYAHANGSRLVSITTSESAIGTPVIDGDTTGQFEGQTAVINLLSKYFVTEVVLAMINNTRPYVRTVVNGAVNSGIGIGSPNAHLANSLNMTPEDGNNGVLVYYPLMAGQVPLSPEVQGSDWGSTVGDKYVFDYPTPQYLYERRLALKANFIVWMRQTTPWFTGHVNPVTGQNMSCLAFLKTDPRVLANPEGGLESALPSIYH